MALIDENLASKYKITISVYTVDKEGVEKTKVDSHQREMDLNTKQLENLCKHLKVISGSLDEWSVD